jgi:hypothetical protein
MTTTFETFKIGGLKFLVLPNPRGVFILDEKGNSHGAWRDLDSFKKTFSLPGYLPVGRAFPQIADGENRCCNKEN